MAGPEEDFIEIGGIQVSANFPVEFKWVTERLAIGGMVGTLKNMLALKNSGFTHVINLQAEFDDSKVGAQAGLEVLWLTITEPIQELPAELLEKGISFASQALANPTHKLYVHCLAGKNRAPIFAYTILRSMGRSRPDAINTIRAVEPKARLGEEHLLLVEEFLSSRSAGELAGNQ
jgi:predicted protein tyrosine phosphatase